MLNKIGKKMGLGLLGVTLAMALPFTAAARDRDDNVRFDSRPGYQQKYQQPEHARIQDRREHIVARRFGRNIRYGYYDRFGYWHFR